MGRSEGSGTREPAQPAHDAGLWEPLPRRRRRDVVVLIEDDVMDRAMIEAALRDDYRVLPVAPTEPLETLWELRPALILLDVLLPDGDGIALCERIKREPRLQDVPIVLVTGLQEVERRLEGFRRGADDIVLKPFHAEELKARVRGHVRTHHLLRELRRKNEELARVLKELGDVQQRVLEAERTGTALKVATTLAHEINNPLAAIIALCDLMRGSVEQGEAVAAADIEATEQQAQRIAAVVKRIANLRGVRFVPYAGGAMMVDLDETGP